MINRRITAVFGALLMVASFATAQDRTQTALRPDSTVYAIDASTASAQLEVSRRRGEVRDTLVVPGTEDEAAESDARLAYDSASGTVFVMWHHAAEGVDEIRLAGLNAKDEWSDVQVIASGDRVRRSGLQILLTHARVAGDAFETTLLHATWWSLGSDVVPEYALIAFENGIRVSNEIVDLRTLVPAAPAIDAELEETGEAAHPPMAMQRNAKYIDVVFGAERTTAVTRVRVEPVRGVSSEARIWRPSGKTQQRIPPARLTSLSASPVQAFVSGDRVVLYTPDSKFRYSVFDNGRWTPIRMIELDEHLTSEHLLQQLRRSVEEAITLVPKPE